MGTELAVWDSEVGYKVKGIGDPVENRRKSNTLLVLASCFQQGFLIAWPHQQLWESVVNFVLGGVYVVCQ